MKKFIFYTAGTLISLGFVGFLTISILAATKIITVGVSPYSHYKLNESETRVIESAIADFRQKTETGKFDEIKAQLAANGRDERFQNDAVKEINEAQENFGKPKSIEFFRCMVPWQPNQFWKNVNGTAYTLAYFTKAEKQEYSERFEWIINENKATLLSYSADKIVDWEKENRARETFNRAVYQNEIKIPFGERFIEIRY